jgi:predicted sugar kinase
MRIDIGAPCSLMLGMVRKEGPNGDQVALLGVALQHPPISLAAAPAPRLFVSGSRADLAYAQGEHFLAHTPGAKPAEIEIDLAIPSLMGLGSEAMLGLSMARALAELSGLPGEEAGALARNVGLHASQGLEVAAFEQGGVLLVQAGGTSARGPDFPRPLRRYALEHSDPKQAWAFVLHWPRPARGTLATVEADRRAAWLKAADHLSRESGHLLQTELWPALEADDLNRFAAALMQLQAFNQAALKQAGAWEAPTPDAQAVLDVLRLNGAVAWGESPTGLARFGLIRGAQPSIDLRHALSEHVGIEGGTVMAAICDTGGARCLKSPAEQL